MTLSTVPSCVAIWLLSICSTSSFTGLEYISGRDNELQKFSFTAALILVEELAATATALVTNSSPRPCLAWRSWLQKFTIRTT